MSVVARMHFPVFGNSNGRMDATRLELTNAGGGCQGIKKNSLQRAEQKQQALIRIQQWRYA